MSEIETDGGAAPVAYEPLAQTNLFKGTPGYWVVYNDLNIQSEAGEPVGACGVQRGSRRDSHAENCANAQLIAAAPAMLEALLILFAEPGICITDGSIACARAAIAKALGSAAGRR